MAMNKDKNYPDELTEKMGLENEQHVQRAMGTKHSISNE